MISRRRWLQKYPAPPPTPEGMVYASKIDEWGHKRLVLVKAEDMQAACRAEIGHLDNLTSNERKRVHETNIVPETETIETNRALRSVGIGLARPK